MTTRDFLNAVINSAISDEMTEKANALLASLDKRNSARKDKPSKTAIANAPIKEAIVNYLQGKGVQTASEIGTALELTTQKASALLRQLEVEGVIVSSEVKVPKKGKVKGYTIQ